MVLWPTLIVSLGDFGIGSALAFFAAQEPGAAKRYVRFAGRASLVLSLALIPVGLLVTYIGLTETGVKSIGLGLVLAAVFIPAALISRYIAALAQGLLRFGILYAIRVSMNLTITLVLVIELVSHGMTVTSAVVAYVVGLVAMTIFTLGAQKTLAAGELDLETPPVRTLASYGLRSLFGALYPVETLFVDQMIVAVSLGPRDLGLYSAALAFTTLPRVLSTAIATAAFPHIARTSEPRRAALRFMGLGAAILVPCGVALTAIMHFLVVTIFGPKFVGAVVPAELLVWGSILFGFRRIGGDVIRGLGAPGRVSAIEVGTWPVMVAVLAIATRGGLTWVAGGLLGVQMLALIGSLVMLWWALRRAAEPQGARE